MRRLHDVVSRCRQRRGLLTLLAFLAIGSLVLAGLGVTVVRPSARALRARILSRIVVEEKVARLIGPRGDPVVLADGPTYQLHGRIRREGSLAVLAASLSACWLAYRALLILRGGAPGGRPPTAPPAG